MPNQIDGKIKEERSKKLIELSHENELYYNTSNIGKDVEVLFEERDGEYIKGHTTNYIVVKYKTDNDDFINQIISVKVKKVGENCLIAE